MLLFPIQTNTDYFYSLLLLPLGMSISYLLYRIHGLHYALIRPFALVSLCAFVTFIRKGPLQSEEAFSILPAFTASPLQYLTALPNFPSSYYLSDTSILFLNISTWGIANLQLSLHSQIQYQISLFSSRLFHHFQFRVVNSPIPCHYFKSVSSDIQSLLPSCSPLILNSVIYFNFNLHKCYHLFFVIYRTRNVAPTFLMSISILEKIKVL